MSVWKNRDTWRWSVQRAGHKLAGSARTREEALLLESRARQELSAGITGVAVKRTISEAFVRYLDSPEFVGLKSAEDIATTKIAPWQPHIAGRTLEQARDAADEAVKAWRARGLAIATINRRLAVLRRVLALAHTRWDWLAVNLAARIALLPGEKQRQVWLTIPEQTRLRRACKPGPVRAAVTLLLCTGMRVGELLKTQPDDLRDGAIFLDARTKTGRPRVVPILPPGERYLSHLPLTITYDGLRSAFDRAKHRAGLPHVRIHDLRHTIGSRLAESGASLRDIQVWLGHTNPATTTRYTHIERARLDAVAGNLQASERAKRIISKC